MILHLDPSVVNHVSEIIFATFQVSKPQAKERAEELVAINQGWGGVNAPVLDWPTRVENQLGRTLTWRCENERQQHVPERPTRLDAGSGIGLCGMQSEAKID